jgi:aspartate/methionine/tyrosine aminotransferase
MVSPAGGLRTSENAAVFGLEGAWRVQAIANALEEKLGKSGARIIHVEIGQPDFATPQHIVEAGLRSLSAGQTRYTTPEGIPELRDAICGFVRDRGVTAEPNRIVVAPGGKCALYCALVSIVSPGDEVLVPDPGFPMYPSVTRASGGKPVYYPVTADHGVSARAIAELITPKSRAIVLNAPHNPSGSSIGNAELEGLAELALRHNLWIVSDEIYSTLQFDGRYQSPLAIPELRDRAIIVDSLSKSHAMPGFRMGFSVMPESLKPTFVKVIVNVFSCITTFVQYAAVEALTGPQECVGEMRREYQARTQLVSSQLDRIPGIRCAAPAGAFYVFPDVTQMLAAADPIGDAGATARLADRILNEAHVALLPGTDFGPRGAGSIRISCATSRENLQAAVDRVSRFATSAESRTRSGDVAAVQ